MNATLIAMLTVVVIGQIILLLVFVIQQTRNRQLYEGVTDLQRILSSPQARGILGEQLLESLLRDRIPYNYETNYRIGNAVVDAAIRLEDGVIPIDSKFPLDNFQRMITSHGKEAESARKLFARDFARHVEAIETKYIKPEENYFDFALMYIPAENVYYELLVPDKSGVRLIDAAVRNRVIPVAPSTLYAYLNVILLGLRGLYVEKNARWILQQINQLEVQFEQLQKTLATLDNHMRNAGDRWDDTLRGFGNLNEELLRISRDIDHQETLSEPNNHT